MHTQANRREFIIKAFAGLGISLCAGSIVTLLSSCESNENPLISNVETFPVDISLSNPDLIALNAIGGAATIIIDGYNGGNEIIIIKIGDASFLMVSSICTHQGCGLSIPDTDNPSIYCGCHYAEFSPLTGIVTKQPTSGSASNLIPFVNSFNSATNTITAYLPRD